jgi:superfamily II helicase
MRSIAKNGRYCSDFEWNERGSGRGLAMLISELSVPESLKQQYHVKGITELYPPQAECIKKGMLEGKNLLVAIPG